MINLSLQKAYRSEHVLTTAHIHTLQLNLPGAPEV